MPASLDVPARTSPTVLSMPQNINPGWQATLDGKVLPAQRVHGWQQGWVLPAGPAATRRRPVHARARLFTGLLVLGALLAGRLRRRGRPRCACGAVLPATCPPLRAGRVGRLDVVLVAVAAGFLTGWAGLAIVAVTWLVARRFRVGRRVGLRRRAGPAGRHGRRSPGGRSRTSRGPSTGRRRGRCWPSPPSAPRCSLLCSFLELEVGLGRGRLAPHHPADVLEPQDRALEVAPRQRWRSARVIAASSTRIVKKWPVNGTMSSTRNSTPITNRWMANTPYDTSPSHNAVRPERWWPHACPRAPARTSAAARRTPPPGCRARPWSPASQPSGMARVRGPATGVQAIAKSGGGQDPAAGQVAAHPVEHVLAGPQGEVGADGREAHPDQEHRHPARQPLQVVALAPGDVGEPRLPGDAERGDDQCRAPRSSAGGAPSGVVARPPGGTPSAASRGRTRPRCTGSTSGSATGAAAWGSRAG